jgi:DNA-binding transcriptional MerR regulator
MAETLKQERLRPVDLARAVGLSTQAVRNYEEDGILPPAARGENGYRSYTQVHLAALKAFMALTRATSHSSAREIMVALSEGLVDQAFEVLDREHSQLLKDRQTVRTVQTALAAIESPAVPTGPRRAAFSVGELAHRIGVTSTTLRGWERAGVLSPDRDQVTGHRKYADDDVRDAELAHLLRRGGHRVSDIALVIREVRTAGSTVALRETALQWSLRLRERSRALLDAAAALSTFLIADQVRPDPKENSERTGCLDRHDTVSQRSKLPCVSQADC